MFQCFGVGQVLGSATLAFGGDEILATDDAHSNAFEIGRLPALPRSGEAQATNALGQVDSVGRHPKPNHFKGERCVQVIDGDGRRTEVGERVVHALYVLGRIVEPQIHVARGPRLAVVLDREGSYEQIASIDSFEYSQELHEVPIDFQRSLLPFMKSTAEIARLPSAVMGTLRGFPNPPAMLRCQQS